jgi:hypothetical protein
MVAAFEGNLQQHVACMCIDALLAGLDACGRRPSVERVEKLGKRVGFIRPGRVVCRQ